MKRCCSSSDPVTRKKYVEVAEAVQHKGGEVLIFSSMHESGQRKLSLYSPPACDSGFFLF
jgi:stalled ribosome rescue protein Dom34